MKKLAYLVPLFFLALAGTAVANTCEVEISANDQIQFDKSELSVAADCDKVTLTLHHSGTLNATQMGHNWVLTDTDEWQSVAQEGMTAGLDNDYLPADDERIIAHTKIIGGGESTSVTFDLSELDKEGDYTFFCSFPGHSALMKGTFKIDE